jgi:hypothetical protein
MTINDSLDKDLFDLCGFVRGIAFKANVSVVEAEVEMLCRKSF